VPRIDVISERDRALAVDPQDVDWSRRGLRIPRSGGSRASGDVLLVALSDHFYVRSRDQATLDAFRLETFGVGLDEEVPLVRLESILRPSGFLFEVRGRLLILSRLDARERPR
jgi:hypothetical protein